MHQLNLTNLNSLTIAVTHTHEPPFAADAWVYEQDTALILSIENIIREPLDSTQEIIKSMIHREPLQQGQVMVKGHHPFDFLAIVHDVELQPICTPAIVSSTLSNIFREAEKRSLTSIAMPLLGSVFGPLSQQESVQLIGKSIIAWQPESLRTVILLVPDDALIRPVCELLRDIAAQDNH